LIFSSVISRRRGPATALGAGHRRGREREREPPIVFVTASKVFALNCASFLSAFSNQTQLIMT